mmetsp:Transcript_35577/g.114780  ORF Transcript_35577/g.114780 Transcript_35577/m.114780 type:complete len:170 (+) Transcript_35577:149-658(+)
MRSARLAGATSARTSSFCRLRASTCASVMVRPREEPAPPEGPALPMGAAEAEAEAESGLVAVVRGVMAAAGLVQARSSSLRSSSQLRQARREAERAGVTFRRIERALLEIDTQRAAEARAATRRGQAEDGLAFFFGYYCVQKVGLAAFSLLRSVRHSSTRREPRAAADG